MENRKLKYRLYVFVVITAFMVFATAGLGVESPIGPPLGPPISNPTAPQTSLSRAGSELIPARDYSDGAEGNRIVTGNVSGGGHFRYPGGIVPYRSDFELATGFGSESLNSFIRRSAGMGYPSAGLRLNQPPYYLPSQTVTSLERGDELGLEPPRVTFPGGTGDFAPPLPAITGDRYFYGQQRPLSRSMKELEDIISREIELQKLTRQEEEPLDKELTEIEQLESYLAQQFRKTSEDKKKLFDELPEPEKPLEPVKPKPGEPTSEEDTEAESEEQPEDFYEQLRAEQAKAEEEGDVFATDEPDETADKQEGKSEFELQVDKKFELPEVDPAEAAAIRGHHKTFKSWAEAKFAEYMKAAEGFLKEGKYYKAADAYTLASVYQRDDPLAYAGKAIALFAAGEYMSSSYFLERAITLSPEYAQRKIDLVAMLVDRDMIDNRIIEMATWQQQSKSPELAFLMAYIFYQNNNIPPAKVAAMLAFKKMGSNPALRSLIQAIDIADQKTK